jgi:hypothetical protein
MCLVLCLAASACDITEVTITELEPNVVVEAFANIRPAGGGTVIALLHGSIGVPDKDPNGPEAVVRVLAENGAEVLLTEAADNLCTYGEYPPDPADPRRCYIATLDPTFVQPSDRLVLQVDLVGGGRIDGGTQVPAAFELIQPSGGATCPVANGALGFVWTPSEGTWYYTTEVLLTGVAADLLSLGVQDPPDSVLFSAIAVSQSDTVVTWPDDFFMEGELDFASEVNTLVEEGMQPQWVALAYVAAMDANFTNWIRVGGFHPSGDVHIPSLRGAGTGVFGSSVVLEQRIAGSASGCN